jgi:hypothetical protein
MPDQEQTMTIPSDPITPVHPMDVARTLDALEGAVAELTACVGVLTMSVRAGMPAERRVRPADWEWAIVDER